MNQKKFKHYIRLYWVRVIVIMVALMATILLVVILYYGLRAWFDSESYLRQTQLAQTPMQVFIYLVVGLIQTFVFVYMIYWAQFKKGSQTMTQSKKNAIAGESVGITWKDVIGMDEAKQEALEVVRLITDRAQLQRIGGKILKGILMLGPPGCGKTYLAKAMATEAKLPFLAMSGSEFVEMYVGVGAGRIRSLFKQARQLAELEGGCIIFIDEMDAVGTKRGVDRGGGGTTEHNQTLNQLLVEMDGMKDKDYNIVIIGATNAAETTLDEALLRPGRFDRKIYVDRPSLEDREKLFEYYLRDVKFEKESVKVGRLARITVGNTPADISNIVREATLIAIRNRREIVSMKDIDDARERIYLGIKRRIKLSEKEKWQIAYHETGHAIITYLMAASKDVFKITITPRGATGGATWVPEREEVFIQNQKDLLTEIKISLGSYAAEKIKLGLTTSGVYGDFTSATHLAHMMVWEVGMGKSGKIGNFVSSDRNGLFNVSDMSETTKSLLDQDVQDILQACLKEVTDLLKSEEPLLDRLAKELVLKNELNYDEIEAIFKEFGKVRPSS